MIPWAKMASDLDLDPAIIRAGRNGREVYLLLLRRCALGDSRGFVSARHLDPEVIARILMCSVAEAAEGVTACIRESLVVTDVRDMRDGVTIVAWEKWNGSRKDPMSVTERKAKSRKLKKERAQVTKVTEVTTEKRREEEKREEISDLSSGVAPPPACDPPTPARGSGVQVLPPQTPGQLGQLVEHALRRLNDARREVDPTARPLGIGPNTNSEDSQMLRDRLRPIAESERRAALDHCLDVLIARAKAKPNVGELRIGMLAGENAWRRWLAETVESAEADARPRAPPGAAPQPRPLRGAAAARAITARLQAQAEEESRGPNRS